MADKALSDLTEATSLANTDLLFSETSAGPRAIQRGNAYPGRTAFSLVQADDIDLANDRVRVLDATDDRPVEITVQEFLFGNYENLVETDDFTLVPGTHNLQIVELGEALPDTVSTVTLDGGQTGIAGSVFNLLNTRNASITVATTGGITMYVNGTATNGTIGARQAATIMVFNNGIEAVFSGG